MMTHFYFQIFQLILALCLIGVTIPKWKPHSAAQIYTAAFLVIIAVTTIAKIVTTIIQRRRMERERKQIESLATVSSYAGSKSLDSYDTAKTINKLLYGATNDYTESYRQNDVLY